LHKSSIKAKEKVVSADHKYWACQKNIMPHHIGKVLSKQHSGITLYSSCSFFLLLVFAAGLAGPAGALFGVSFLMARFFLGVCVTSAEAS
jgi:hypothetical protein